MSDKSLNETLNQLESQTNAKEFINDLKEGYGTYYCEDQDRYEGTLSKKI